MFSRILPAVLSCSGLRLTDDEKKFFAAVNPLGINLFGRNIKSKAQLQTLISELRQTIGREDLLIAIDQEGGRVRRLTEPEFRPYASAMQIGSLPFADAERAAGLHATLIAADLRELGINVNYAPVLDLLHAETDEVLKSRCFGTDKVLTTALGKAETDAYIKGSIIPCLKHLPGHGRAAVDPHLHLPRIGVSLDALAEDFYPFRMLNDCPLGMTAHIIISAIDDALPVSQSPTAIRELIRGIIGFDGLLISDAIDMRALSGTTGHKAEACLRAGCDAVCYAAGDLVEMRDIAAHCPPMSDKSLERFAKAKKIIHNKPQRINLETLAAEYQKLTGGIPAYRETYDATEVLNALRQNKQRRC